MKALLLSAGLVLATGSAQATNVSLQTVARPEGARQFWLATPSVPRPGTRPLVILLHGHGGSAAQMLGRERSAAPLSAWLEIADRDNVLIAAPEGASGGDRRQGWNDCRADAGTNPSTDDVGMVAALIARAVAEQHADPHRVYVMGMSNGGMMAYRLAIEMGNKLAAFGSVAASMAGQSRCAAPTIAVPAFIVNGTSDPMVPFAGGQVSHRLGHGRGGVLGAEASVAVWRQLAGQAPEGVTDTLPHRDPADRTTVQRTTWGDAVVFMKVEGGGHVEPSIAHRYRPIWTLAVGPQNGDFETAEAAWDFFRTKRR